MSAPPHLIAQIAKARALVAERQAACKEAWPTEGCDGFSVGLRCFAFHQRCTLLREAEAELRTLEAQVPKEAA